LDHEGKYFYNHEDPPGPQQESLPPESKDSKVAKVPCSVEIRGAKVCSAR